MAGQQRVYRQRIRSTQALKKMFRAQELIAASLESPARSMLLDLSACRFMDSAGIRTLIRTYERARAGELDPLIGRRKNVREGKAGELAQFELRQRAVRNGRP